jgi:hypothetical protein
MPFSFNDYFLKDLNEATINNTNTINFSSGTSNKKQSIGANRNWRSMSPSQMEVAAVMASMTEKINSCKNEINASYIKSLVDLKLKEYNGYSIDSLFKEYTSICETVKSCLSYYILDIKAAYKIINFIKENEKALNNHLGDFFPEGKTIETVTWQEIQKLLDSDSKDNSLFKIGELDDLNPTPIIKSEFKKFNDGNNDSEAGDYLFSSCFMFYKYVQYLSEISHNTSSERVLDYNEVQSNPKRFWDMIAEIAIKGRGIGEFTLAISNLFLTQGTATKINDFSFVYNDYNKYISGITEEVDKFLILVENNKISSYEYVDPETGNPKKYMVFLNSTYRMAKNIKARNNEIKSIVLAQKKNSLDLKAQAYEIVFKASEDSNIVFDSLRNIGAFFVNNLLGGNKVILSSRENKARKVEDASIKERGLMAKSEQLERQYEAIIISSVKELYDMMLSALNKEAKRIPSEQDPTAAKAFEILSVNLPSFFTSSKNWVRALKFKETEEMYKNMVDETEDEIGKTESEIEILKSKLEKANLENNKLQNQIQNTQNQTVSANSNATLLKKNNLGNNNSNTLFTKTSTI